MYGYRQNEGYSKHRQSANDPHIYSRFALLRLSRCLKKRVNIGFRRDRRMPKTEHCCEHDPF